MFILSTISSALEFSSVDYTLMYEKSELKVFKNLKCFQKFLGVLCRFLDVSSNWPNDLLGINVYKTLESCW